MYTCKYLIVFILAQIVSSSREKIPQCHACLYSMFITHTYKFSSSHFVKHSVVSDLKREPQFSNERNTS